MIELGQMIMDNKVLPVVLDRPSENRPFLKTTLEE